MDVMAIADPAERARVATMLYWQQERIERDRELVKGSGGLHRFTKIAFPIVEPGTEYIDNWHIGAICEHLEAMLAGQIRNLLINIPPRHMKSLCSAVMLPAWMWITRPYYKFLCASYAAVLSTRDALKTRRLIQTKWYQDRWGDSFYLTGDQNAKTRYENNYGGYRISTSVDGTATGEGGDMILVDDPHNMREIHSDIKREGVLSWWDDVMSTRLNNPKTGCKVIIMQRGHEGDLAGHVKDKKGWVHLNLPAEYEFDRRKTVIGWMDPRKKKNELLWPERFGPDELQELKDSMTPYAVAGQLQQRPAPLEGGIFKREWLKLWPHTAELPYLQWIVQSYDTGFTEKTMNDPTACNVFGIFKHPKDGVFCALLLDSWSDHLEWPKLRIRVRKDFRAFYGEAKNAKRPNDVLVEEKGSGITLLQDLKFAKVPCHGYNPGRDDKIVRANGAATYMHAGRFYVLESKTNPGQPVAWAEEFLSQLFSFPNAMHDDHVDTFSQAIIYFRDKRMVDAPVKGHDKDDDEDEAVSEPYKNPYAE